ncbi:MAG: FKBP-type peptidyl-prolyl cis-trans isomerase [Porphyromonas sp.]|nr:FKBP-type peptidyl-prolyl cis-trans isomerase [Porphyromonas sp.]
MAIQQDSFVACSYDLYAGEGTEKMLIEQATLEAPLQYIQGGGLMLPAFEENLQGLSAGDSFDFILSAQNAYGEYNKDYVVTLEKTIFTGDDGKFDSERVVEGRTIPMLDSEGNRLMGLVQEITETHVMVDFNHPMAGEDLHFVGKVLTEHPATDEERAMIDSLMNGTGEGGCSCGGDSEHGSCGSGGCGGCGGGCC